MAIIESCLRVSGEDVFAADRRGDGAVFFELGEDFVHDFFVKSGKFGHFGCIYVFAGLAYGFDYSVFVVHNEYFNNENFLVFESNNVLLTMV